MQDVKARFAALREGSRNTATTSGAQRAERLRSMLAAVLANKQRFYDAAHTEMKACDLDVAAQLVMVKSEVDFVAKRVAALDEAAARAQLGGDPRQEVLHPVRA